VGRSAHRRCCCGDVEDWPRRPAAPLGVSLSRAWAWGMQPCTSGGCMAQAQPCTPCSASAMQMPRCAAAQTRGAGVADAKKQQCHSIADKLEIRTRSACLASPPCRACAACSGACVADLLQDDARAPVHHAPARDARAPASWPRPAPMGADTEEARTHGREGGREVQSTALRLH
jgi:hypothetical protein